MEKNSEAIVEAALFIAGRFMSLQELVMFTGVNPITLKEVLTKLEEKYKSTENAMSLLVRGENYKLDVKNDYSWLVNKLAGGRSEFTKAEQETMAIIAYKQPITQSVVVKIRGNKAYDHIKRLKELGLIKGKRLGHTMELSLSDTFYEYFNMNRKESSNPPEQSSDLAA